MAKRGKDISKLNFVINQLAAGIDLDEKYKDHQLQGRFRYFRECHIEADWLLMYRIDNNQLFFIATDTGSHSDLFG